MEEREMKDLIKKFVLEMKPHMDAIRNFYESHPEISHLSVKSGAKDHAALFFNGEGNNFSVAKYEATNYKYSDNTVEYTVQHLVRGE